MFEDSAAQSQSNHGHPRATMDVLTRAYPRFVVVHRANSRVALDSSGWCAIIGTATYKPVVSSKERHG